MRLSGLSYSIKPVKKTFLIIISLLFIMVPFRSQAQEAHFSEFNEKGMETGLRYGENIREDAQWREFSRNVKTQTRAGWEAQALSVMMESLGLTADESATNAVFLKARADWEVKADRKIEEMYGKWRVKKDWDFQIKGGEIRKLIVETVWKNKDGISNIENNLLDMESRVKTSWADYLSSYDAGLNDYLDTLTKDAPPDSTALENYTRGIEETAKAQLLAAAGLGGQFIKLEEDKYIRYMGRIYQYQQLIQSNNLIFDELSSSNIMSSEITNVLSAAGNLESPLSAAMTQIIRLQSNAALIAETLAVPANYADTLMVGIKDWQDMVENAYKGGITEWDNALSNLLEGMDNWEMNAAGGYTYGYMEWQTSLEMLINAKADFQAKVYTGLTNSQAVWDSKINAENSNLSAMIAELSNLTVHNIDNFNSYESGLFNSLGNGPMTLGMINNNIEWIIKHIASIPSLTDTLPGWAAMRDNISAGITKARNDLYAQLYSGEPGTGVFTPADNPDLYFMSDTEMVYGPQFNELKYLKQNLDIARAVMNYALSASNMVYSADSLSYMISQASNNYKGAVSDYDGSTNALERAAAVSKIAAESVSYYVPALQDAGTNLSAAEAGYDISHSNYNAYVSVQTNLSYLTDMEYSNLIFSIKAAEDILTCASSNYYANLGLYYLATSNYNASLAAESALNELSISNYVIVREGLGMLEWAMMPGILGVEENPFAAVSAADVINPAADYNSALTAYNAALAGLAALSNQIASEAVLPAGVQSKLNDYAGTYGDYGALLDAAQAMNDMANGVSKDAQDSWFNVTALTYPAYQNNFDAVDYYDVLYNSVVTNLLSGKITLPGLNSLMLNVVNNYSFRNPFNAQPLLTPENVINAFNNYTNTAYEDVFRLAFGILSNNTIDAPSSVLLDEKNIYYVPGIWTNVTYNNYGPPTTNYNTTYYQTTGAAYYQISRKPGHSSGTPLGGSPIADYFSVWLDYWGSGDNGQSSTGVENGRHYEEANYFWGPSAVLENTWNGYRLTNRLCGDYTINVSQYTNTSASLSAGSMGLDASRLDSGFLSLLNGVVSDFTGSPIRLNSAFLDAEKGYIAESMTVNDGKISTLGALQVLEGAYSDYLNNQEADIRMSMSGPDKLYIGSILGVYSNALFRGGNLSRASFADAARRAENLTEAAYGIAYQQEAALQQDKWGLMLDNMTGQAVSENTMWGNIFTTGTAQWDSTINLFANAMGNWDIAYQKAWNAGTAQWDAKTNSLEQRKEAWTDAAVNVVSYGSADYIADTLGNAMDESVSRLLSGDLPGDVNKAVINKAAELRNIMMPKNSAAYLDFFNNAVSEARVSDVKFVIGGIQAFTGDSMVLAGFNSEISAFKKNMLDLSIVKMKDEFANTVRQTVSRMNMNIDRSDRQAQYNEFAAMIMPQGWYLDGSTWVKKDVTVDSSLFGGDKKESFGFRDYYNYTNRLNGSVYTANGTLDRINGDQTAYNELMAMVMDDISGDYSDTMAGLNSHIGSTAYSSSGEPAAYSGDTSRGELYRITWAMSYYGYLQSVGEQKANTAFWDKPLWDTDPYYLKPGVGSTSPSLFAAGKAIGSAVILVAGSICSWGSASVPLALWVAAFNAGAAMTHDTVNLATGHMKANEYGLSMLKDTISGAASVGTSFIDPTGSLGSALLSTGINSAANLATGGLRMNADGKMDWKLDREGWNNWAMSSAGSMAGAGVNSGLNIGKNIGGWTSGAFGGGDTFLGASFGYGMQKATEGFISSSLSTLGSSYNMFDNSWKAYDWNNVWQSTASAGVNGAAAGAIGSSLGGIYSSENGKMFFENNSDRMQNTMDFFGSIAGQNTRYAMGGTFDIGLGGSLGMSLTHDKGWIRNDSAQGIDLAQGIIAMDTFGVTKQIGNFFGSIGNAIGSGVSWLGQQAVNIADAIVSTLPFGKNGSEQDRAHFSANSDAYIKDENDKKKMQGYTEQFARTNPTDDQIALMDKVNSAFQLDKNLDKEIGKFNDIAKDLGLKKLDSDKLMKTLEGMTTDQKKVALDQLQMSVKANQAVLGNLYGQTDNIFTSLTGISKIQNGDTESVKLYNDIKKAVENGDSKKVQQIMQDYQSKQVNINGNIAINPLSDLLHPGQNLSIPVLDTNPIEDYKINGPQLKSGTPIRDQINKIPFVRTIAFGLESIADGIYSGFANGLNSDEDGYARGLFGKVYTPGEDSRNRQNSFMIAASLPIASQEAGIYALSGISSIGLIETAADGQPFTLKKAEMMTLKGLGAIPLAGAMVNRYGALPYLVATSGWEDGLSIYNSSIQGAAKLKFGFGGTKAYRGAMDYDSAVSGQFASLEKPISQVDNILKNALHPSITGNRASYLYQVTTRPGFYVEGIAKPIGSFLGGNTQIFYKRYFWQKTPWQNVEYIGY